MFFKDQKKAKDPLSKIKSFIDYFHEQEDGPDFALKLALTLFQDLETQSKDDEELMLFCMEDIIYAALYATFYEHIFLAIRDNKHSGVELIDKFSSTLEQREQLLATQTQDHLNYVLADGQCPGCKSCENHKDVVDMVPYWQKRDFTFFVNMFLGMHTIQFAFEQFLYDLLPYNLELASNLDSGGILTIRKHIFSYTEKLLK